MRFQARQVNPLELFDQLSVEIEARFCAMNPAPEPVASFKMDPLENSENIKTKDTGSNLFHDSLSKTRNDRLRKAAQLGGKSSLSATPLSEPTIKSALQSLAQSLPKSGPAQVRVNHVAVQNKRNPQAPVQVQVQPKQIQNSPAPKVGTIERTRLASDMVSLKNDHKSDPLKFFVEQLKLRAKERQQQSHSRVLYPKHQSPIKK